MLTRALQAAAGNGISTVAVAEAIDFDGTNDYLSLLNSTSLSAMTCSLWFYVSSGTLQPLFSRTFASSGLQGLAISASATSLSIKIYNSNGGQTQVASTTYTLSGSTFYHVVFSGSLASAGSLKCYINDVAQSNISLSADGLGTNEQYFVARFPNGGTNGQTRLSNVYLKNNSIDLSVEANRRLFVTADLKPAADQAALNPILYLPMDDPTQPGLNAGTGGDFTLTGTVARSGRGPNQYNAPYSDLDGTADYLSRTSVAGIADGKQVTFSCNFKHDTLNTLNYLFSSADTTTGKILFFTQSGGSLTVRLRDAAGTNVLEFKLPNGTFVVGRNYVLTFSIDLTDTAKRSVYVNGQAVSATWVIYTNADADLTNTSYSVGVSSTTTRAGYFDGQIGALWFNTSYIDLSNPDNLAKFVTGTGIDAKPVDLGANGELPFGTAPLIYLPMYGNNAGKNYGTGGDFTVNSGPYTGARGPNEFWGNRADFDGSTGYLSRTSALAGVSDGKTFSFSYFLQIDATGDRYFALADGTTTQYLEFRHDGTTGLTVFGRNAAGTAILSETAATAGVSVGNVYHVCGSYDMTNQSLRRFYVNGVGQAMTVTAYVDDTLKLTAPTPYVGRSSTASTTFLDGKLSEFYFTTDYIDFSQEANRLKFRDAFGNPVDLTQQIEDAAIPNPAIYMRFDPASFGTNSGTGGDFTVNGTITDGGQL